jgi:hypothetical protein
VFRILFNATVKAVPLREIFEDNFPVSKFHHPGIQAASLLLYEILNTQVPETDSEEENSTEQNK